MLEESEQNKRDSKSIEWGCTNLSWRKEIYNVCNRSTMVGHDGGIFFVVRKIYILIEGAIEGQRSPGRPIYEYIYLNWKKTVGIDISCSNWKDWKFENRQ